MEFGNGKVLLEVNGKIATVTMNSAENANALDANMNRGLKEAFNYCDSNDEIRAVILTGTGKFFVAGADIAHFPRGDLVAARKYVREQLDVFLTIEGLPKPVIAAVNGFAFGGGLELILFCDLAISSDKAQFSFPEAGLGMIPPFGLSRLPGEIPRIKIKEWMMLGTRLSAEEAERYGMVNKVVPAEQLLQEANAWAETIIAKAPLAIEMIKSGVNRTLGGEELTYLRDSVTFLFGTHDVDEGMTAFIEKRQPRFIGK